jgi:hypothetical protein
MLQVNHANSTPSSLVFVGWSDPPSGRTNRLACRALGVDELVVGHDEVRAIGDVEATLNVNPVPHQLVDLGKERLGVKHDPVPDGASNAGMKDSAGDLVKNEGVVADVNGMARIRAALVPHDPVGPLGQHVNELALAFVAPLGAHDNDGSRLRIEHRLLLPPVAPVRSARLVRCEMARWRPYNALEVPWRGGARLAVRRHKKTPRPLAGR